ncbi:SpoIID/LytB domain-containing protein [Crocinitomix algicola]|uniref:SpoIID/LytB domain-containing protein n=1 Tax=Crocinitomix algicola TaxID=1740263 RepID=UPI0008320B4F|nr:SpoIID/LytB domain-containing protein [Crocinitomix algicola]
MRDYTIGTLEIKHNEGNYEIIGDTVLVSNIWDKQSVLIKRSGDKIKLVKNDKTLGYFDSLTIRKMNDLGSLRLQCLAPSSKKSRRYNDNFIITPEGTNALLLINQVSMANYLGGVIESEGGGGKPLEYYKVQAILSRTYALGHLNKHKKEGFQLCDRVHCQAYHNKLIYTATIRDAVAATEGILMLNKRLELAQGFFFANCGGQTSEADFVWNNPVAHCKSIVDTFCIKSRQATWTKKIDAQEWRNYLVNEFGYPINDSILGPLIFNFDQPFRKAFYLFPQLGIPLRDIRIKFRLKSTWFSCKKVGNEVVLTGKGFGHGVGVCQEGAMGMARHGFNAAEILNFYFTDIHLMNYLTWSFYRQRSSPPHP